MANPDYHWQLMKERDPVLFEKTTEWRTNICAKGAIPKKYVELMRVAMAAVMRSKPTLEAHMEMAIEKGATGDEIFEMLSLVLMMGGIPAYREACLNLEEQLVPFYGNTKT